MNPLPAADLRSNLATWAVSSAQAPAVARIITDLYPSEPFDPDFQGQQLKTVYFDTRDFALRKARNRSDKYLTLRIRCYEPSYTYALSAKTENQKFRVQIPSEDAETAITGTYPALWASVLPGDLVARLLSLTGDEPLRPAVCVRSTRYAVENNQDRFTFDLGVTTDTGKNLEPNILELKSTVPTTIVPSRLEALNLRPIKLSKFLWATQWR
jgi:hypothetical protein